jgi:hypothetical protein
LLIVEVTAIDSLGKAIPYQPGIWDDSFIPGFKRLVDTVHRYGAKIALVDCRHFSLNAAYASLNRLMRLTGRLNMIC